MKNKTACCYLTHEHPLVIEEVLENIAGPYSEKGIDIYIYDSSANDDTERIVDRYTANGCNRLFYIPVKNVANGDEKYLRVLSGEGLAREYDYIWPTKDRCWFTGDTLDKICEAIDADADVVFAVDERDRYELVKKRLKDEYTDPVEFFGDYGALTTNWECLIRRKSTLLDPIDWDDYIEKYNLGANNNFNQPVTLFARLAEMDAFSARIVRSGIEDKRYSDKAQPMWIDSMMNVWIERWIPSVYSLPSIYDEHKLSVIKTQLGHVSLFGSNDSLVRMRDSGALTPERVSQLQSMWQMISPLPKANLDRILAHDEDALFEEMFEEYRESFAEHDYEKGYYLFFQNNRISERFDFDDYVTLALSYYIFHREMRTRGYSILFDGVNSPEELIANFRKFS